MSLSDAIEIVGAMLKGYPNGQNVPDSYIGALANVIAQYPRCITHHAADPLKGVPRETRFLPTVADVVGWCEREVDHLRGIVERDDRERHIQADMKARADETAQLEAARKVRPTLQEMQEKHGPSWGIGEPKKDGLQVKSHVDASLVRANRVMFERECRAAKVDPASPISPSLAKLLNRELPRTEAAE